MCGIAGILQLDVSQLVNESQLVSMHLALKHRGPDDEGIYRKGNIGLAHRRLSIIDLSSNGHQPFTSLDGRYQLIFNGEIYNYREFQNELLQKGYRLKSDSDTEVLLYLYIEYGSAMLSRLNGMFAFAIWDEVEQRLFLGRDRMGVKPLYYTFYNNALYFASEQKALFAAGVPLELEDNHWNEFLLYRFVSGSNTLFKNIYKLLPGHFAYCENGNFTITRWWNLAEKTLHHAGIKKPLEWFEATFDESIRYRMVSDVPVGVLLSGGLDSSSVLASLHQQHFPTSTFTVAFTEKEHDESALASRLSAQFDYPHYSIRLEREALYDTLADSSYYNDEPLVHSNDPHLLSISRFAKKHVSVLLSGEGSDELMAGYVRYRSLRYQRLFPFLRLILNNTNFLEKSSRIEKLNRYLELEDKDLQLLLNASNSYPSDFAKAGLNALEIHSGYRDQVLGEAKTVYPEDALRQLLYLDQHTYLCSLLDRNDRSTMGASIECREPFLDYRLVEGLATLPTELLDRGKKGKYILKTTIGKRLPEEILNFRKIGLSVPWTAYLLQEPIFKHALEEMVHAPIFERGILKMINIKQLLLNFQKGDASSRSLVIQLFMIHIWYKTYTSRILSTSSQALRA